MPITKELLSFVKNKTETTAFFETGLLNGECFGHALNLGFNKVCSIEINQRFIDLANGRYGNWIQAGIAHTIADDSANLALYLDLIEDHKCLFWLDAHLDSGLETAVKNPISSCPLKHELEAIAKAKRKDHVIMIDDLRIITSMKTNEWASDDESMPSGKLALDEIKSMIFEINPQYEIEILDGYLLPFTGKQEQILKDDILVAFIRPGNE